MRSFRGGPGLRLTQVVPFVFGVLVDVFLGEAAEEYAVETRVQPVQVGPADVTDARLRLRGGGTKGDTVRTV